MNTPAYPLPSGPLSRPPAGVAVRIEADAAQLALHLAARVAEALQDAIAHRGRATLWVSGGSTPVPFFQALSAQAVDWAKVQIALVDDRWCEPANPDSNEGLVRRLLWVGPVTQADFQGWYRPGVEDPVATQRAQPDLAAWVDAMPWPADVVVLGMGGDGHTASWFPETAQYAQATQPGLAPRWLCTDAPSLPNVPRPRATLTLGAVRDCHLLCVHTTGAARAELLARVWQGETAPIGALWQQPLPPGQAMPPVEVYWAP